jgi:hypothetical protein
MLTVDNTGLLADPSAVRNEYYVYTRLCSALSVDCGTTISRSVVNDFIVERDFSRRFHLCRMITDQLMPWVFHLTS